MLCELQEIYSPGQFYNHPKRKRRAKFTNSSSEKFETLETCLRN